MNLISFNTSAPQRILFLNPMGATWKVWKYISVYFENEYEICFCDYPGYGDTPMCEYEDINTLSDEIYTLLRQLLSKPLHIISCSFGSWVAQRLIENDDIRLESLVLIGSSERIYAHGRSMIQSWLQFYQLRGLKPILAQIGLWSFYTMTFETTPGLLDKFVGKTLEGINDDRAILSQMTAGLQYTISIDLDRIACPTLILRGAYDCFYPQFCSVYLNEKIRNSSMIEVADAGHAVISEKPQPVAKEILKFIKSLP